MNRDSVFIRLAVAAIFGGFACISSLVFGSTWNIDPAHSSVHFKIRHMMISNVEGTFADLKGSLTIDDKTKKMESEATIGVASVSTTQPDRDNHLKSPDFFDVAKYPTITFKSTESPKSTKGKFDLKGLLTMHGESKPITLHVEEFTAPQVGMKGEMRRGMSATAEVDRTQFGMKWNKALDKGGVVVGEKVKVELNLEYVESKPTEDTKTKS